MSTVRESSEPRDGNTLAIEQRYRRAYTKTRMSIYDERRDDLDKYETMMGVERGRLAVTLDLLTDALVLVGQHGVYCQSARQPGKPAMDVQMIASCLTGAKELIASVMAEIKQKRLLDGDGRRVRDESARG